ncbi:MAG TPA: NF038122 family metalloprotease [Tepidisphaeraceae bacterium]|jgi:hypothetical protein|nr:NF038122 family metalloprotease [Tepidisphaeraceae bacterium]
MSRRTILLSACALLASATSAKAITIVLTDTGSTPMTAAQLSAFTAAANIWQGIYYDPITVNINIEFASLPTNVLGSTTTRRVTHPWSSVRSALIGEAGGSELAADNLLPVASIPLLDINGTRTDASITMSSANAKALGLGTANDPNYGTPPAGGADARIQFATAFASTFDYDRSDGVSATKTDFVTVAAHEIGHVLGFFSLTDVQDGNPGFTLHPSTLDMWRFNQTGGVHNITTENRQLTAGPAEYYDSVLNNRQFSRGMAVTDSLCNTFNQLCQASHWRDSLGNLMDPTIGTGVSQDPTSDDKHAVDYIGYSQTGFLLPHFPWKKFIVKWFPWPPPVEFPFDPRFERFAAPPDPSKMKKPNFEPNLTAQMGLDLGIEGMSMRSGVAFVRFMDERLNPNDKTIENFGLDEDGHTATPPPTPQRLLPPELTNFYFESDDTAGKKFVMNFMPDSETGAQYDPGLGQFGGYRLTGFIDAEGDGVIGDVDAKMTVLLLADDSKIPKPDAHNVFSIGLDQLDNSLLIYDSAAFGIAPPQWNVDGGGTWGNAANWLGGIPSGVLTSANFLGVLTAGNSPAMITLDGDRTVGGLVFDNPNSYIIDKGHGGTLTIGDATHNGGIDVLAGKNAITAPLVLAGNTAVNVSSGLTFTIDGPLTIANNKTVLKTGAGNLLISGEQDHASGAALDVAAGTVTLASNAGHSASAIDPAKANLAVHVGGGGSTVNLRDDQDLRELNIDWGDAGTQTFNLNTPAGAGQFRSVRVYPPDFAAAKAALYAAIVHGIGTGDGVVDSGLPSHPSSKLGIAIVADAHGDMSLLIRPTRIGDLNLDGQVSIADFIDLASHFNGPGTWQEGDLNGDFLVTISDFIDLSSNFNMSYSGDAWPIDPADAAMLADFGASHGAGAVPEPAMLSLLMPALLLGRRRRCA